MADEEIQGVPAGVSGTPIQGVPPGVTGTPVQSGPASFQGTVQGVPPGVTGTPIGQQKPAHWYDTAVTELGDVASGFKTALNQTGETGMKVVGSVIPDKYTPEGWKQSLAQTHDIANQPLDTGGKMAGAAIENILEFVAGDEALKGLSTAAKLKELSSVERALQKSPKLTRMLGNAVRAQAVGTAQAAAHGASGGEAVAQGSAAAIGGAAVESAAAGAGKFLNLIRPTTTDVLGEELPTLASQKPGASPVAENIADIRSEPQTARQQQEGGLRAIVNRAQRVAASELHKLNAARAARWVEGEGLANFAPEAEPIGAGRQLTSGAPELPASTGTGAPELSAGNGNGAPQLEAGEPPAGMARTNEVGAYEGDFPPSQNGGPPSTATTPSQPGAAPKPQGTRVKFVEEAPPNFSPIDVLNEIKNVRSFGDAAELIRKHASPVFQRFNEATGGEYMRLRNLRDAGYETGDYTAVKQAEKAIDDLLDTTKGKLDRLDYKTVRTAWKSSRVLDAVHDAVSKSINIPDEGLAEEAGVWRGINGGTLMRGVNRLVNDYGRTAVEDLIGKDGITGLYRLSSLTQSPQRAALYGEKAAEVAHAALADKRAGFIPSTIDWSRRALFHSLAVNPRAGQIMDYAIKHDLSASTVVKILVPILADTTREEQKNENQTTAPKETATP